MMEIATSGKFLDPAQNPTHILIEMKRVSFCLNFSMFQARRIQLNLSRVYF